MSLTWKDALTTLLVILVAGICFTPLISNILPALGNVRSAFIIVIFLGITIHFIGYQKTAWKSAMMFIQVTSGVLVLVVALIKTSQCLLSLVLLSYYCGL